MRLIYKASEKELMNLRNSIFVEKCIPALNLLGFEKCPFSTSWFGRNNLGDYSYYFSRIINKTMIQIVTVEINKGDTWIQVYLNIFKLVPAVEKLEQLNKNGGLKFFLPPNSLSEIRLPYYKNPPILQYRFWFKEHKIGYYLTKNGLTNRIQELGDIVTSDIKNMDYYISRWHEKFIANTVDWEGNKIV